MVFRRALRAFLSFAISFTAVLLITAPSVQADTFEVSILNFEGAGSLREAIDAANANTADADIITFAPGLSGDIVFLTTLDILGPLTIDGPGPDVITFQAPTDKNIFHVNTTEFNDLITIRGLSLTGGNDQDVGGGAIYVEKGFLVVENCKIFLNETVEKGGAIYSQGGLLRIIDSVLNKNIAETSGGAVAVDGEESLVEILNSQLLENEASVGGGVAVFDEVSLIIRNSLVNENVAMDTGGGFFAEGENVAVLVDNSQVNDNQAGSGGGIAYEGSFDDDLQVFTSNLTILYSQVSGNTSCDEVGGILGDALNVLITNSTIADNGNGIALPGGNPDDCDEADIGGIYLEDVLFTMVNSTVSGNQARGSFGGIYLPEEVTAGFFNVTISDNVADYDLDGYGAVGGIASEENFILQITMENSILAGNSDALGIPDCLAPIFSTGYNLLGNNAGCQFAQSVGDLVGTPEAPIDPGLEPLADNGGPTPTHALSATSPAVDAGNPNGCVFVDENGFLVDLPIDQRDAARPQGARCDMGAYERQGAPPPPDDGSGGEGEDNSGLEFSGGGCDCNLQSDAGRAARGATLGMSLVVLCSLILLTFLRRSKATL